MTILSISAELSAFVLIFVVFLFAQDRTAAETRRRRIFMVSLGLAALSIALNILTVMINLNHTGSAELGYAMNTIYFLCSGAMSTALAIYLFDLLLEHVHDSHCWRGIIVSVAIVNIIYVLIVLANLGPAHGLLFTCADNGGYERGPLYQIGYAVPLSELVIMLVCFARNRKHVSRHIIRVVRMTPPVLVALVGLQLLYPDMLLNGTIFSVIMLIAFINFQSTRIETDSLTHLGTRTSFYENLELYARDGQPFQIITVSLLDFGTLNRRFGHRAGDEMLYLVGNWLDGLDPFGRAYRYGKVSFCLLRRCSSRNDADMLFEQVAEGFDRPWEFGAGLRHMDASCTDLNCSNGSWTPEQIIAYLDAMNETAKATHTRRMRFDAPFRRIVDRRLALAELLKDAIANQRFRVCYQPIFDCRTEQFTRMEALVRLNDDEGHPVSPEEFIPLAEQTGLLDDISDLVLAEVCTFLHAHPQLPMETVSINLSLPQMLNPELTEHMVATLNAYGIEPSRLRIEITERMLSKNEQRVTEAIRQLRAVGIGCSLDDFGVGYSNLAGIAHLPLDCAKIDRSLIMNVPLDERSMRIVRMLVELLASLGIAMIAEGVETDAQAAFVRDLGVEYIQGYYYAHPLEAEELAEFLNTQAE